MKERLQLRCYECGALVDGGTPGLFDDGEGERPGICGPCVERLGEDGIARAVRRFSAERGYPLVKL